MVGWDPDMRRDVPTAPVLAPQPKERKNLAAVREQHSHKKGLLYTCSGYPIEERPVTTRNMRSQLQSTLIWDCVAFSVAGHAELTALNPRML